MSATKLETVKMNSFVKLGIGDDDENSLPILTCRHGLLAGWLVGGLAVLADCNIGRGSGTTGAGVPGGASGKPGTEISG